MHRSDAPEAAPATSTTVPSGFRPVEGAAPQRDGAVLMVEAYVAVWLILMVFVLAGYFRQRRLDARLARLESAMDRVIEREAG
jgi:hypothetical protein